MSDILMVIVNLVIIILAIGFVCFSFLVSFLIVVIVAVCCFVVGFLGFLWRSCERLFIRRV